jgi:hypothetical protein
MGQGRIMHSRIQLKRPSQVAFRRGLRGSAAPRAGAVPQCGGLRPPPFSPAAGGATAPRPGPRAVCRPAPLPPSHSLHARARRVRHPASARLTLRSQACRGDCACCCGGAAREAGHTSCGTPARESACRLVRSGSPWRKRQVSTRIRATHSLWKITGRLKGRADAAVRARAARWGLPAAARRPNCRCSCRNRGPPRSWPTRRKRPPPPAASVAVCTVLPAMPPPPR